MTTVREQVGVWIANGIEELPEGASTIDAAPGQSAELLVTAFADNVLTKDERRVIGVYTKLSGLRGKSLLDAPERHLLNTVAGVASFQPLDLRLVGELALESGRKGVVRKVLERFPELRRDAWFMGQVEARFPGMVEAPLLPHVPLPEEAKALRLSQEERALLPYVLASGPEARGAFTMLCKDRRPDVRGFFRAQLLAPGVDIPPRLGAVAVRLLALDRTIDTPTLETVVARFPAVTDLPEFAAIAGMDKLDPELRDLALVCLRQGGWRAKAVLRCVREAKRPAYALLFVASPVFGELTAAEQTRLLEYFTLDVKPALALQEGLLRFVTQNLDVATLRRWLREDAGAPWHVVEANIRPGPYTVRQVPNRDPTLVRYAITIGTRTIPLIAPRYPSSTLPPVEWIAQALSVVPDAELALLAQVTLTSVTSDDTLMTAYPWSNHINVYPVAERGTFDYYVVSLRHEFGHLVHYKFLGLDMEAAPWQAWKRACAEDVFAPSKHARKNSREDFAETWLLYQRALGTPAHAQLRKLYPARFRILDEIHRKLNGQAPARAI